MGLAQAPAVEDHLVAGFPLGMGRGLDGSRQIDAGNHGKAAHHRRLAGDRKTVLVIERRPLGADGDVAIHEIALVEIGEAGL